MKVCITGAGGFIAWHLRCLLAVCESVDEVRLAFRDTLTDPGKAREIVAGVDVVFHLAGINRAPEEDLRDGNAMLARILVDALTVVGSTPMVMFSSSTHAIDPVSAYGEGKSEAAKVLGEWANRAGARFIELVIPHVFGEFGRPEYNSVVATFCHRIVNGCVPQIINDGQLELIHVQDLVDTMLSLVEGNRRGRIRVSGVPSSVRDVANKLMRHYIDYLDRGIVPDLSNTLDRNLFNSLRSYIKYSTFPVFPHIYSDDRGRLFETVKVLSGGQSFVSATNPGVTRGNHFHRRKFERFVVLSGEAVIRLRKLFCDDVVEFQVGGDGPGYVDIPTLHTHSITNVGDSPLVTQFWTNELYDNDKPDTYSEAVVK